MAMRHARAQAFAAWATSMAPRHVGRGPGFVNEDQAAGVEIKLTFEPFLAALQNIRALLLAGVRGLFLRVMR
jgi:hypothetical protein